MNILSRTITGIITIIAGLFLVILCFFVNTFVPLIYGIPILVIGIIILFNKKEDKIEEIRRQVKGGKKR